MFPLSAFRRRLTLLPPLLALLLIFVMIAPGTAPAFAQNGRKPAAGDKFEETSDVVAVEVPVNVVGRDGQPVRGLSAADFEIFDNGDRQEVTDFEVIDLSSTEAETRRMESERIEELGAAARRHFLLLFDLSFSSPTSILKARLAARDFLLRSLHPADLAAVATYSLEHGPKLVLTFTPDRAQLARAIDTLGLNNVLDARERDPLRFLIDPGTDLLPSGASSGTGGGAAAEVREQKDQAMNEQLRALTFAADKSQRAFEVSRITAYSRSLAEMARALNAVQGRKHILFFSEGFDSRLLLGRGTGDKEPEQVVAGASQGSIQARAWADDSDVLYGNTGLQKGIGRMLEEFRRADSVIQAVDVGGLRGSGDAAGQGKVNGQEALFYMANETGGELFKDANDLGGQLDRVLTRTSVTYLLTFQRHDLKTDGDYHRLRVRIKAPQAQAARISYRSGYYAPRPFKELNALEKNLLASDSIITAASRRDVALSVLAAAFRANEEQAYVPVIVEIGGRGLLAGHTGDKLNLELYAYVADKEGKIRDFFTQAVSLDIKNGREALERTGIKYYGHIDLAPGDYQVRVLVRNADTGRTGVEAVPLSIPTYAKAEPHLLPPLFIEGDPGWLMIREREGKDQQATVVYPFTVKGEPYVPAARPILRKDRSVSLCLVGYNLGSDDLKLEGQVTAADGKSLTGGRLSLVERTATGINGLDKVLATFQPTGLQAGDYVLRVAIKSGNGRKEESSLPFVVQ